jgi:pilus assembly protein Flp/PilA
MPQPAGRESGLPARVPADLAAHLHLDTIQSFNHPHLRFGNFFGAFSLRQPPWRSFMFTSILKLLRNEDGATAIEYGLIAALIAVAAVTVMGTVGTNLSSTFNTIATKL